MVMCSFYRVYRPDSHRHDPNGTPATHTSPPSDTRSLPKPDPRPELDTPQLPNPNNHPEPNTGEKL